MAPAPKGNSNAAKDWIGRKYGSLTVVGTHGFSESGRRILWCQCVCGKDVIRGKDSLYPDSSCGCQKRNPGNTKKLGWMKPGLEPTEHPTVRDIIWAAGIYEGEGWPNFTDGARGRVPSLQVGITQKDRWLLDRLRSLFGGAVRERLPKTRLNPQGQYYESRICDWYISGTRARGFLMTIWQFLSPRRKAQLLDKGFSFRR